MPLRAERKLRLGIAEDVAKLAQTELRIERHRRHPGDRISDHRRSSREVRLRPHGHAIATMDAGLLEQRHMLERSAGELRIRPRLVPDEERGT